MEDEVERARLKSLVGELVADGHQHGYIVRTNAAGQPSEALAEDIAYLGRAWALIEQQVRDTRVGTRIYQDLTLPMPALRALMSRDVEKVTVELRHSVDSLRPLGAQSTTERSYRQ